MPSAIWEYFPSFSYFAKNEKRGKCLPVLHEATFDNYFIINCLFKLNTVRVMLFANSKELA